MLVVLSDTHGTDTHRLRGRTLEAVETAESVVHAGDFTTVAVLDAFEAVADRIVAVHGNRDDAAVRERLPADRTVAYAGVRIALAHGHDARSDPTARSLFAREREAQVVVTGHTHRPVVDETGPVVHLNPGSHAEPRGGRPAHAELHAADGGGLIGSLRSPDGATLDTFRVGAP
jgi:putative phosphoesterase